MSETNWKKMCAELSKTHVKSLNEIRRRDDEIVKLQTQLTEYEKRIKELEKMCKEKERETIPEPIEHTFVEPSPFIPLEYLPRALISPFSERS